MREYVDIHVKALGGLKRIGFSDLASAPFTFGVKFAYDGEDLTKIMGFNEVRINFNADEQMGRLELIRAEHQEEYAKAMDVVMDKDCPEGDGLKLLVRKYVFVAWEIKDGDLVFYNCTRGKRGGGSR